MQKPSEIIASTYPSMGDNIVKVDPSLKAIGEILDSLHERLEKLEGNQDVTSNADPSIKLVDLKE